MLYLIYVVGNLKLLVKHKSHLESFTNVGNNMSGRQTTRLWCSPFIPRLNVYTRQGEKKKQTVAPGTQCYPGV